MRELSCGLAVFLKTPGLTLLKTRLAAGIGTAAAERWYLLAADAVIAVAQATPGIGLRLALAETDHDAIDFWRNRHPDLAPDAFLAQGKGGLGDRMASVHCELLKQFPAALLVGADAPQLTPDDLSDARDWLAYSEPRLCLGPARDGGFWLVGANRRLPSSCWVAPRYSTSAAAKDFRTAAEGLGAWHYLRELVDVDEAGDLADGRRALDALNTRQPAQSKLLHAMHGMPESTS